MRAWLTLSVLLLSCGSPPRFRVETHPALPPRPPPASVPPSPLPRFVVGPASDSTFGFDRIAKFPEPGWQVPRDVQHAPDGSLVTWLESEDASKTMSLYAFDRATKKVSVLLR